VAAAAQVPPERRGRAAGAGADDDPLRHRVPFEAQLRETDAAMSVLPRQSVARSA
jgi:hypothetical protein